MKESGDKKSFSTIEIPLEELKQSGAVDAVIGALVNMLVHTRKISDENATLLNQWQSERSKTSEDSIEKIVADAVAEEKFEKKGTFNALMADLEQDSKTGRYTTQQTNEFLVPPQALVTTLLHSINSEKSAQLKLKFVQEIKNFSQAMAASLMNDAMGGEQLTGRKIDITKESNFWPNSIGFEKYEPFSAATKLVNALNDFMENHVNDRLPNKGVSSTAIGKKGQDT